MAIAVFGPMKFSVSRNKIYTFDEFSYSSSINTEDQELENTKPAIYVKGLNADTFSFEIKLLKQRTVNVRAQIVSWLNLQNKRKPYLFIINNKPFTYYKFLLTNVEVKDTKIDCKGDFLKATLNLTFKEYFKAGKKPPKEDKKANQSKHKESKKKVKKKANKKEGKK